jgi:hypothetical protein
VEIRNSDHSLLHLPPSLTPFSYCCVRVRCRGNVFAELLPRNGRSADNRKHRSSVAACVYVTGVT